MGNGDASTGFSNSVLALLIIWIGNEQIPFSINHVCVQIVRACWVICIVPIINKNRVCFVGDVDECSTHLNWVAPLSNVRICIPWVNKLILLDDVFTAVVLEVLYIQNLGVGVVVDADD